MRLVEIQPISSRSITEVDADFIILKNTSSGLFGPEQSVNRALDGLLTPYSSSELTQIGAVKLMRDIQGIAARNIVLVGVGIGFQLRYKTIKTMCHKAVEAISRNAPDTEVIATVSHGVGFGLDMREVFKTQIFAFKSILEQPTITQSINKIVFNEIEKIDFHKLITYLEEIIEQEDSPLIKLDGKFFLQIGKSSPISNRHDMKVANQKYIFIAMPFKQEFENVYDFGLRLPIEKYGFLPIRSDKEYFEGSIMEEIKRRIRESAFVIADVSTLNPNVLFELGFAQGCGKPTIIICKKDEKLPFDVSGMNVIFYNPLLIRELNEWISAAILKVKNDRLTGE